MKMKFNNVEYNNKKQLANFLDEVRKQNENKVLSGQDKVIILNALSQFADTDKERIRHLCIAPDEHHDFCLHILFKNGTWSTCSIKGLLTPPSFKKKLESAMRKAIEPQIKKYRDSIVLPTECSITGVDIIEPRDLHIDHSYPNTFSKLAKGWKKWLIKKRVEYKDIELERHLYGVYLFADDTIKRSWQQFHKKYAILAPAHREANRSLKDKDPKLCDINGIREKIKHEHGI